MKNNKIYSPTIAFFSLCMTLFALIFLITSIVVFINGDITTTLAFMSLVLVLLIQPIFFTISNIKALQNRPLKYWFMHSPEEIKKEADMQKSQEEAQADKLKAKADESFQKLVEKEGVRETQEKYSANKANAFSTALASFSWAIYLIIALIQYFRYDSYHISLIITFGLIAGATTIANSFEERWEELLKAKEEAKDKSLNKNLLGIFYDYDKVYFDSEAELFLYNISKVIIYLSTFVIVGLIGIILFSWLGSISIAPTTIIIILLIIIIINQNKNN